MPGPAKHEILMDGVCPFCQWTRARIEPFDTDARLRFLDYNDAGVAATAPFTREQLAAEMHVHAPDGAWHAGFAAWVVILKAMPPLRWLGGLLGSAMFTRLGPQFYRWIARNRYRLPGAPPPCRSGVCDLTHSPDPK